MIGYITSLRTYIRKPSKTRSFDQVVSLQMYLSTDIAEGNIIDIKRLAGDQVQLYRAECRWCWKQWCTRDQPVADIPNRDQYNTNCTPGHQSREVHRIYKHSQYNRSYSLRRWTLLSRPTDSLIKLERTINRVIGLCHYISWVSL